MNYQLELTNKKTNAVLPFNFLNLPEPAETLEGVTISLNDIGRPTLILQFGVDRPFAEDILEERKKGRFSDIDKVEERMDIYYKSKGYTEIKNPEKFENMDKQLFDLKNSLSNNNILTIKL